MSDYIKAATWFSLLVLVAIMSFHMVSRSWGEEHNHALYDSDCCSPDGRECRPVTCNSIEDRGAQGVFYRNLKAQTVRPSKDNRCHACVSPDQRNVWCVYTGGPEM